MSSMRIRFDGEWTSTDFFVLFRDLSVLENLSENNALDFMDGMPAPKVLGNMVSEGSVLEHFERYRGLSVDAIKFNSPGFTDLSGAGKIIEQIRLFLEFCINLYVRKNDRVLDSESKKLDVELKRARVDALKKVLLSSPIPESIDPKMLRYIKHSNSDLFFELIVDQKITGIEEAPLGKA